MPSPNGPSLYYYYDSDMQNKITDPREGERDLPIEVLIGGDNYWRIVKDVSTIRLSPSLVLRPKTFGWILNGNRTGITAKEIISII